MFLVPDTLPDTLIDAPGWEVWTGSPGMRRIISEPISQNSCWTSFSGLLSKSELYNKLQFLARSPESLTRLNFCLKNGERHNLLGLGLILGG